MPVRARVICIIEIEVERPDAASAAGDKLDELFAAVDAIPLKPVMPSNRLKALGISSARKNIHAAATAKNVTVPETKVPRTVGCGLRGKTARHA